MAEKKVQVLEKDERSGGNKFGWMELDKPSLHLNFLKPCNNHTIRKFVKDISEIEKDFILATKV